MTRSAAGPASTAGQHIVRLSGPQGIVAAIEHCLGFTPEESLVLVCLAAPRDRVGPVARIDLPPPGYPDEALLPMLECARRYADSAAIVCYHDGSRPGCIDDLTRGLRDRDIPVVATLSVFAGRIHDARSAAASPGDGGIPMLPADDPRTTTLRSAALLAGRSPLPNRAALAASIAPPSDCDDADMRRAIATAAQELAPIVSAAPGGRLTPGMVGYVDAALTAVNSEYRTGRISAPSAARAIAAVQHLPCRDLVIARTVDRCGDDFVGPAIAVAARCPDDWCADWCAVLAVAAYRSGDGALAHCALDRTVAAAPRHRLAHLLRSSIDACIPPASLDVLALIPIPQARGISRDAGAAQ